MLVPEALSQSIRHLFVFYLVARSCERQCDQGVEPAKHQRPMANSRVCARSPAARVIWSRFGPKPRRELPAEPIEPAFLGVDRRGNVSRRASARSNRALSRTAASFP
jgi:hypothetical protein